MNCCFNFRGAEFPKNPKIGDIVIQGESVYTYLDDKCEWGLIENLFNDSYNQISNNSHNQPKKITYPTNCKNCGAVMKSCTCEYCGTTYSDYEETGIEL